MVDTDILNILGFNSCPPAALDGSESPTITADDWAVVTFDEESCDPVIHTELLNSKEAQTTKYSLCTYVGVQRR